MKKAFSLILALTLVLGMATTAFAADITPTGGNNHDVTASYVAGQDGGTVYGVDISWGSMVFVYNDASKGTWNAETHKYENAVEAAWSCAGGANVITVTNHSNAEISVIPSYTAGADYSEATMTFDKSLILATADNGEGEDGAGKATTGNIIVTAGGKLTKDDNTTAAGGTTIGQITLTLADVSNEKATITGLSVTIDGTTYNSSNTSASNPAVITSESSGVTITVMGTYLGKAEQGVHSVYYAAISCNNSLNLWSKSGDTLYYTQPVVDFANQTTAYQLQYTNDGATRIDSGVWIIYEA